ncbi:MAG: hypothetical protein OEZ33_11790 [Gammaproteobacteria bacterium]|nr:hypothetical protein [Gammaproteobacteria bacterium]
MKHLIGILLLALSTNIANAACASYTSLISETGFTTYPITNVVVEGYNIASSHTINFYVASLDYNSNSYACKHIQYQLPYATPTNSDDLRRDEFIKSLKLSMSLGYKLSSPTNTNSGNPIILTNLGGVSLTTP